MSLIIPNFKDSQGKALADLPEVVLAQMLQQAQEPVQLAFLQQSYTLNRDLQVTGLQNVPYWNVFDDLQQVKKRDGLPLTIYDFPISEGTEPFFNTNDNQVLLYRGHELKTEVKVHKQIEVEQVKHFLADGSFQIDNYDDRGFLSTSLWLTKEEKPVKTQWFNPFHEVVAEMDNQQKVTIAPKFRASFSQNSYSDVNQLVSELYERHFKRPAVVIAAFRSGADEQNSFYLQLPAIRKIALLDQDVSLAKVRDKVSETQKVKWVFPSQILEKQFLENDTNQQKLDTTAIEPYPTAFTLGSSNEIEAQIVYWQFQQQSNETVGTSLTNILPLVLENDNLFLLVDGSKEQMNLIEAVAKQWIRDVTEIDPNGSEYQRYSEVGKPQAFNTEEEWMDYLDEHIDDEKIDFDKDQMHQFYQVGSFLSRIKPVTEKDDINEIFNNIRLFVDQGIQADLRKQILAISAGVPIISFAATDLVEQEGNGFQATTSEELPKQFNYFLQDLHHWNQSLVDSVSLMEKYEANQLLQRWKVVMTDA